MSMYNDKTQYGSVEYYKEFFSDVLADVQAEDVETSINLVRGFVASIESWMEYHDSQTRAYESLAQRVRKALIL